MGFRGRTWKNLKVAFPGEARGPGREQAGPGAAGGRSGMRRRSTTADGAALVCMLVVRLQTEASL